MTPASPDLQPRVVPAALGQPKGRDSSQRGDLQFHRLQQIADQNRLRAAFTSGQPISFPTDSIEVKANWKPAGNRSPSEYYISTASDNKPYALVSMHIISKKVPNWTWATFEQQDNPGRCDYIGCHDHFGATVQDVDAHATLRGRYNPCVKTAAVKKILADAGLPPLWENYCLKGSQVDFTTATGVPTRLGNSVTESSGPLPPESFVPTSSCMTYPRRSAITARVGPPSAGISEPACSGGMSVNSSRVAVRTARRTRLGFGAILNNPTIDAGAADRFCLFARAARPRAVEGRRDRWRVAARNGLASGSGGSIGRTARLPPDEPITLTIYLRHRRPVRRRPGGIDCRIGAAREPPDLSTRAQARSLKRPVGQVRAASPRAMA